MDKNVLSRFIRGVFSTSTGVIVQIILGFLGFMIVVRFVPKGELGIYILIEAIYTFFGLLSSLTLENLSVTRFIASAGDSDKIDIANVAMSFKVIISLLICLIILLCKPLIYPIFRNELLSKFLIYVPLLFFLSALNDFLFRIQQGFHQYKKMAIANIIQGLFSFLFIIVFLVFLKMRIRGLIYAYIVAFAASISYQYKMLPIKKRPSLNLKLYKTIFKFGFPLGLNNILYFVYSRIDRLLLGAMINSVGVAYYEVASRIPNKSQQLYGSFNNVFFPNISEYFAKKNYREAEDILNNSLRLISFATIFVTVIATIFQKEIVVLLFSKMYIESAPVLSIMMVSLSITITGTILGTSLVALGQSDKPVKINLVNAAANVVCNLILIPIFGFIGAAYAALISHSIALPFYVWLLKKSKIRIRISQYLKPLLGYLFLLAIFILIGPVSIITKLTLIIVFLIFCICLSIIRKKDILNIFEGLKPSLKGIK